MTYTSKQNEGGTIGRGFTCFLVHLKMTNPIWEEHFAFCLQPPSESMDEKGPGKKLSPLVPYHEYLHLNSTIKFIQL